MRVKKRNNSNDCLTIYAINALPREKILNLIAYWYPEAFVWVSALLTPIKGKDLAEQAPFIEHLKIIRISLTLEGD